MAEQSESAEAALSGIVASTLARQPKVVEQSLSRIREEIEFYRDTDVVSDDEIRRSLTANLEYIITNIAGGNELDLRAPDETGRARATRGVPLADMLAGYRLSFSVLWREVVAVASAMSDISMAEMATIAERLFELHERYAAAAVDGYRDEARHLLRLSERERAVLVEVILAGTASAGSLWQAAQTLGLSVSGVFLVVAAESPQPGQDPLPRAEAALAGRDVSSVWRLEAERSLGVLSLGARPRMAAALEILDRHASGRIGASPIFFDLSQAGWARRLAQLALEAHHHNGVRQFPDSPLDMLVAAAPDTAIGVARAVLKELVDLPSEDRDQLLDTLQAWLDAGGSAKDAGAVLFCHANTIRYRLRRVESLTGRDLTNPADLTAVVAAARAWQQLPHDHRGVAT
ncbi:PucR family transcriptional regulator [Nakamurella sp.]|uniref:PucR family transcriptional regulator n=1 Tax=Nakamurella sp. TaxID=1869182 RepID=UPI003783EEFC